MDVLEHAPAWFLHLAIAVADNRVVYEQRIGEDGGRQLFSVDETRVTEALVFIIICGYILIHQVNARSMNQMNLVIVLYVINTMKIIGKDIKIFDFVIEIKSNIFN